MIADAGAINQYKSDEPLPVSKEASAKSSGNKSSQAEFTSPIAPSTKQPENSVTEDGNASPRIADTAPTETLNKIIYRTNNREALQERSVEAEDLLQLSMNIAFSNMKPGFFNDLIAKANSVLSGIPLQRWKKLMQICPNMENLLQEFEAEGVEIFPEIKTGRGDLDLFMRFPVKQYFAIALRAVGHAAITYREDKEALYFKYLKGAKGVKRWNIDHLKDLSDQEFWIRKNERELFGGSARDVRRPLTKILVLTGETKLGNNAEHLYLDIGGAKVLSIQQKSITYVVEETELGHFIRHWLKKHA